MRARRRGVAPLLLAAVLAGFLAVGVSAAGLSGPAGIPSADGVIHGCYDKAGAGIGRLRAIDAEAGKVCKSGENPLNWEQHGVSVLTGGSFPDFIGCIACDGAARFMGPGMGHVAKGLGHFNAGVSSVEVPMPGGTLTNLRVHAYGDTAGGYWAFEVWVNGRSDHPNRMSCTIPSGGSYCEEVGGRVMTLAPSDRVSVAVGHCCAGSGDFYARWSMEFTKT